MTTHTGRPSLTAVAALLVILATTVAWWSLALWPLDSAAADWIVRTRLVCFGASHTGLPNAGGWLLLIGEPIGMLLVLRVVWRDELRAGLARVHSTVWGKLASLTIVCGLGAGLYAASMRVAGVMRPTSFDTFATAAPLPERGTALAPALRLYDQRDTITDLQSLRGQWVMITFAFGHCEDMCPVIVQTALQARQDVNAREVPLVVVSLDPWRDTRDRLPHIAQSWKLDSADRVLSGDIGVVNATLDAWGIARSRDTTTGEVLHGSTIVLVDPDGRLAWRIEGTPVAVREALEQVKAKRAGTSGT
jgi:cytochrome oxidase Cu insertion factor (SCO1/SenC/PrrC family)